MNRPRQCPEPYRRRSYGNGICVLLWQDGQYPCRWVDRDAPINIGSSREYGYMESEHAHTAAMSNLAGCYMAGNYWATRITRKKRYWYERAEDWADYIRWRWPEADLP